MATPTPANFATFVTNANTMAGQVYQDRPTIFQEFTTTLPVTSSIWETAWTGRMPKMRLWQGSRVAHPPGLQTYRVSMQPWENTYELDRFKMDDDQYGVFYRMLIDLAEQAKLLPDFQTRDLLENAGAQTGTRQLGWDGLTYFNTAHPVNIYDTSLSTYSNDFSGGGANISYSKPGGGTSTILVGGALSPVAIQTLWEYMSTIQGEDGETLAINASHIIVPSLLKGEAELLLKSMFFAPAAWGSITGQVGAADNPIRRFGLEPIVNPYLKQQTTWYMGDMTRPMKPLLWLNRVSPVMVPRTQETDPVVFDRHMFQWGEWARAAPGFGPSWLLCRSGL